MYFVLHLIVLLVPGLCLVHLLRVRQQRCGIALGLSYLIVVVLLAAGRQFHLELSFILALWLAIAVALILAAAVVYRVRSGSTGVAARPLVNADDGQGLAVALMLAAAGVGAVWLLGPYLEVPADVLRHLDNIQLVFADLADGRLASEINTGLAYRARGEYWFYLHCILTLTSATAETDALLQASMANTAICIVVVFGFSQILFKELDPGERLAVAVLATVLFVLFFGINVFAWMRYYALAPAFLALPLYFVVMGMLVSVDRRRGMGLNWLLLAGVLTVTAGLVHRQEALFIYVIGSIFVVTLALRHWRHPANVGASSSGPSIATMDSPGGLIVPWWLLGLATTALAAFIVIWSHLNFDKNPVVDGEVLELRKHLPTVRDIHILDPTWKFYRTIGAFGVLVYFGLLIYWSRVRRHLFLLVAMFAPVLHVFNPVFADAFLRHSWADTLWRLSYTVPITFVGALLLMLAWRKVRDTDRSVLRRAGAGAFLLAALATLGPTTLAGLPTWTRWQTLKPVEASNSMAHFADLAQAFRGLEPPSRVHTDPVTAYVLMASSQADAHRTKFFRPRVSELDPGYYSSDRLAHLDGHLVVINLRDGAPSETGRLSGHWPAVITATSAYYSSEFIEFVRARPNVFRPVWANDKISLYRIHK